MSGRFKGEMYKVEAKRHYEMLSIAMLLVLIGVVVAFVFDFNLIMLGVIVVWLALSITPQIRMHLRYMNLDQGKNVKLENGRIVVTRKGQEVFNDEFDQVRVVKTTIRDRTSFIIFPWENDKYFYYIIESSQSTSTLTSLLGDISELDSKATVRRVLLPIPDISSL